MHHSLIIIIFLFSFFVSGCDSPPALKPLNKNAVILAFGDSLTYGTGAARDESYPAQLQQLIHHQIINAGIPGEVTRTGLTRLPALLKQHQPDLLILCHGGNDILRHYNLTQTQQNLQQMIDLAKQQGTEVVLLAVPQFGVFLSSAPFYAELAEHNQIPIENETLSSILKKSAYKSDHIHPNAEGYRVMAEHIGALLKATGAI